MRRLIASAIPVCEWTPPPLPNEHACGLDRFALPIVTGLLFFLIPRKTCLRSAFRRWAARFKEFQSTPAGILHAAVREAGVNTQLRIIETGRWSGPVIVPL